MYRIGTFLVSCLTLGICSCAGPGVARPDSAAVLAEGKARAVPIYIYSVSWSSPNFGGGRMQVGVADIDEKDIDAIELGVSTCGIKGEVLKPKPLFLSGPFLDGRVYASFPSLPIDYADFSTGTTDIAQTAVTSGHIVINSITLYYADGSKQVYDKDLKRFMADGISNFCSNAPGTGNLPPSATVERH